MEDQAMRTLSILQALVNKVTCKPGWTFRLLKVDEPDKSKVWRLVISVEGFDSRTWSSTWPNAMTLTTSHYFPVPEATYNEKSWRRWLFDRCCKVENHEMSEWFMIGDERPFAPLHGPGCDPYVVRELSTSEEVRTDQAGVIH